MNKQNLLVVAAGGTGGHMFPAQALAEEMLRRGWRVKLSTDVRGARYTKGFPEDVEIDVSASSTFARGGIFAKLAAPFLIVGGIAMTFFKMRKDRPSVVVGFGGYPSIPALSTASLMKLPRMLHEQNGVLGKVNQLFATHVHKIACGTWPTELPQGITGLHIGNPVRAAVLARAAAPYMPPGDYPMSVLVIGGSQGARILSDIVPSAFAGLSEDVTSFLRISHQARPEDLNRVKAFYRAHGINAEVEPFFGDLPRRMAEAQLVISRSGASSVADISVIGRPSVLVPLAAAIRSEQHANARGLVESGGAFMMDEKDFTKEALRRFLTGFFADPQKAQKMANQAAACGLLDAAIRLADEVAEFTERQAQ